MGKTYSKVTPILSFQAEAPVFQIADASHKPSWASHATASQTTQLYPVRKLCEFYYMRTYFLISIVRSTVSTTLLCVVTFLPVGSGSHKMTIELLQCLLSVPE